jgi:hypothetical protein
MGQEREHTIMSETTPQPAVVAVNAADWSPAWSIERLEALRARLIERHPEAAEDAELIALFQGVRDELGMVIPARTELSGVAAELPHGYNRPNQAGLGLPCLTCGSTDRNAPLHMAWRRANRLPAVM